MSRIRVAFMGTPAIARGCLDRMAADSRFEIVGVVSQPDRPAGRNLRLMPAPVKARATELGLPVLSPERASEPSVVDAMRAWGAELVVVVAFGQLLKKNFLATWPGRVVNVHASLLPRWRGAAPMQRALMAGDARTGVCLQVMAPKLDSGPVFGARTIPLPPELDAVGLFAESERAAGDLLTDELVRFARGELTPSAQDEASVTLAPKIEKHEARLDFARPAAVLHNRVRGLAMGPTAFTTMPDGRSLKVHRSRAHDDPAPAGAVDPDRFGVVVRADSGALEIQCNPGRLELLSVQPDSRARLGAAEFVRGYQVRAGDRLGGATPSTGGSR